MALSFIGFIISINSALPTLFCYAAISRHFKKISSSDKVKKMHTKLYRILLLQMFLQMINLSIMFLDATIFNTNGSVFESSRPADAIRTVYWLNVLIVQHACQRAPFQPCCINACSDIMRKATVDRDG
ncbi:hypothetical protein Y032_0009g548 [Ancylostoma ceylanicum]|nr:hypothetical protein Y032_0009g548 [Ancylostoma ceylanicum]